MKDDVMENTWLAKMPDWSRWVLCVPVGLVGIYIISNTIGSITTHLKIQNEGWSAAIHLGIVALTFILVTSVIAPKHQRKIATMIGWLGIIFTIFVLVAEILSGGINIVRWNMFIPSSTAVAACCLAAPIIVEKLSEKK